MLFKLLCLHRDGIALSLAELAKSENYVGNLIIQDGQSGNMINHTSRQARLLDTSAHPAHVDLVAPLFDPVLVKMTEKQMTLQGYQVHAESGAAVHYAQFWELRLVD
jgi:hypothetical protein